MFDFLKYMEAVRDHFTDFKTETGKKLTRVSSISGLEEFLNSLFQNTTHLHLIVVTSPDGVIQDPSRSDNYQDIPHYRFYVVGKGELLDAEAKEALINRCKQTGLKIFGKMLKDKQHGKNGLAGLDFGRIPYLGVGPFGNNYFGVEFAFTVSDTANFQIEKLTQAEDFTIV